MAGKDRENTREDKKGRKVQKGSKKSEQRKKRCTPGRTKNETGRNPKKGTRKQREENQAEHATKEMGNDEMGHQVYR